MSEPDRLSYSFGLKLNIGNYQSADFHVNYSSDVKDGETIQQAFKRIVKFVEEESEKKYDAIRREFGEG